ncbi:MAG TPA: FAD-dependent oxidoreductase, partial [Actinomycetaceae bacterium]|nr:FAD-dependent oxidoreductase [Actinomycetaceae bacterium]
MDRPGSVVVVGGGLAAAKAAEGLRSGGFDGSITIVGEERAAPYERPPLSKGYLMGTEERETVFAHPADWYAENDVELILGTSATALDLTNRTVVTSSGPLRYEALVLATGSSPRHLPFAPPGGTIGYLRTLEDSERLRVQLQPGRRIVLIGGGWIGLEVAAAARTAGCEVVVLEASDQPLQRALGQEVAEVFAALHTSHGVELWTGISVADVRQQGEQAVVRLDDGASLTADFVVVGVGAMPNTELAQDAGLTVDNGIVVDEWLRTSHPDVLAAGDVARAYHPRLGRHVRVEHWDTAVAHGKAAARSILGEGRPADRLPTFFTDQYDVGIEYVGDPGPDGYDQVVLRGDPATHAFTAFWL